MASCLPLPLCPSLLYLTAFATLSSSSLATPKAFCGLGREVTIQGKESFPIVCVASTMSCSLDLQSGRVGSI